MTEPIACWCGNADLVPFCPGYARCPVCETLVSAEMPAADIAHVVDEDRDFYGREYWFSYQQDHLRHPTIVDRARSDLPERCLYWLQVLLKYRRPPARVLELGSGHGGFVAMLRWAGFDATGLEISPWVVDFARKTFDVPVLTGPIEDQSIGPASLDVIALMDVLEHLRDPAATMRQCLRLLKPDGILLIQTPCYPEGSTYEEMAARSEQPIEILQPGEHLYLFSRLSIRELFARLGAPHITFEPALFAQYDMFPVVSRMPLVRCTSAEDRPVLTATPSARIVQALLDERAALEVLKARRADAEEDRARRLVIIDEQGRRMGELEAERNNLLAKANTQQEQLAAAEADRAARLSVIEEQGRRLGEVEAERNSLEAKANTQQAQFGAAARRLDASEAEVRVQMDQIQILLGQLRVLQQVLRTIQDTRIYAVLRKLGRWKFIDHVGRALPAPPLPHDPAGERRRDDRSVTGS